MNEIVVVGSGFGGIAALRANHLGLMSLLLKA